MKPVDPIALGKRVAARRQKKNLSQPVLAARVGMRQQGIGSIEEGKVKRPKLLRELAAELGTTEEWLLWEQGPEEPIKDSPIVKPSQIDELRRRLDRIERKLNRLLGPRKAGSDD
jgi:transcriptional regulator with XRE-family HTH domain